MPKVAYSADTSVRPDRVLQAAIDFSERRPEIWPNVSPKYYEVHEVGDKTAEITEGSPFAGGVWARYRYDWSEDNVIATVLSSNVYQPGGVWEMRVEPKNGGSHVECLYHKQGRGLKGRVLMTILGVIGPRALPADLKKTLAFLESESK